MMNRILPTLGLLLFLSFNMSAAGPLKPFSKDGKWGFVDKDMNIVFLASMMLCLRSITALP